MIRIPRFAPPSLLVLTVVSIAGAQTPAPPRTGPGDAGTSASASAVAPSTNRPMRRSIVHHYPYPYPEYYHGDQTAGFRNPGGQGRFLEYYPAGNKFQESGDPVRVAKFDTGFGNRQEQLQSIQIGVSRENAIMNHIDSYARPSFGVGYFGGFY